MCVFYSSSTRHGPHVLRAPIAVRVWLSRPIVFAHVGDALLHVCRGVGVGRLWKVAWWAVLKL